MNYFCLLWVRGKMNRKQFVVISDCILNICIISYLVPCKNVFFIKIFFALFINITTSYFIPIFYYTQNKNIYSWHFCLLLFSKLYHFIGTRFVDPPFKFFNSSPLWDVFIINSVKQLQTWPNTQSEIDISPFLKTQKPSQSSR